MAAGDLYIECDGGGKKLIATSGWLEKLNALAVKTAGNKYGLRTVSVSAAAEDISPLVACGDDMKSFEELFGWIIVESASGEPALGLVQES